MIVRLSSDLQFAIPSWMLDPVRCSHLREVGSPVIAMEDLKALADLVERQLLSVEREAGQPCSTNDSRGCDEQKAGRPAAKAREA